MSGRRIDMAQSLARVRQGGIPLRAEERLAEEAGPNKKLFTSDLGVSEFLMARDAGCEPIAQIMGSSIYHVAEIPDYKGKTAELTIISDAHRESRRRALARLWQEAALVGADAVIGAHLRDRMITMGSRGKGGDDGGEVMEFTAVGTAIAAPWITHAPGAPVVTDLSGQELWALAQDGFEPCGFVFDFCRYHVWHVLKDYTAGLGEVSPAQTAIDRARRSVETKIEELAAAFEAEFVVGSDVSIDIKEVPCGWEGCVLNDLDVDVSWMGTAIRRVPGFTPPEHPKTPPLILSMMPLGRRTSELFDDDDDDDIEELAREAEEEALEADEKGKE